MENKRPSFKIESKKELFEVLGTEKGDTELGIVEHVNAVDNVAFQIGFKMELPIKSKAKYIEHRKRFDIWYKMLEKQTKKKMVAILHLNNSNDIFFGIFK